MRLSLAVTALAFGCLLGAGPVSAAERGTALVLTVRGPITPSVAEYVERGVARAEAQGAPLLVLELDTPGGLDSATRVITRALLNAQVPAAVFVAPSGARAASAGAFITIAAEIAAMAPGTNIGAAHPVNLLGKSDEVSAQKAVNDAAASLRSIAERRGRNGDWAEKAVRESTSLTATQALEQKVVDLLAPDLPGLLAALEGRTLAREGGPRVLATRGLAVERVPMDWRRRLLAALGDPNIAYLLLTVGMLGIFFELSHPGVIFPGVIGGIAMVLGLYALQALPVSGAGLLLILLAGVLLFAELNVASHGILGTGGVIALALGSLLLARSPQPWLRVSLTVAVPVVAAVSLFSLVVLRLVLRARRRPPATGSEAMRGQVGEAVEDLAPAGKVFVRGEVWDAVSPEVVRKGDRVRVEAVRGLTLEVRRHREEGV